MIVEIKTKVVPVGFLHPELMSSSLMISKKSYVVEYLTKALYEHAHKKMVMFVHNNADQGPLDDSGSHSRVEERSCN